MAKTATIPISTNIFSLVKGDDPHRRGAQPASWRLLRRLAMPPGAAEIITIAIINIFKHGGEHIEKTDPDLYHRYLRRALSVPFLGHAACVW
ncbi:MAG: hypothetical protein M1340_07415 [Actinobacteria bacterium]|nr:hypothetical protein [Actinomycetota bacterium]